MIDDILALLKLITDPEARKTVQSLAAIPSRNKLDWKRDVRMASSTFSGEETYKVAGFANALLTDIRDLNISETEVRKLKIVFDELVRNAFEHGCKETKGCKVKIKCTYSPWFIILEVSDAGSGFDFEKALSVQDEAHGLQLVNDLAFRLTYDKKSNLLTTLIMNEPLLQILPRVELHREKEILILTIVDERDWNYLIADWEPLRNAVQLSSQVLILIDCSDLDWVTKAGRIMKKIIREFKEYEDRRFALVVEGEADRYFDFSQLNAANFKVFVSHRWSSRKDEIWAAKEWLTE